ncbi:hypothetical protein HNP84_008164 [Thermocatellispora tengchongensis]|uniref:Cupin domain-containing protein n=1 Tax=Thermocatellispora tengchongensis TaxID=1073253 RepID=A0A840PLB8_9ACTN|nr:hypothetical protein [Thermocatellispora tengchongensis]MBB5138410.1 hypothetical protein [Thermocatellispora tengchongensis]
MLQTFGEVIENGDHVGLSFRATDRWTVPEDLRSSARTADTPFDSTALLLGDAVRGPVLLFLAVQPGFTPPDAPAHGHASDNFRLSLRGVLPMGPESYGEGEFRFQRGWKPYPSDNYAHGPEGGWTVLCFADRRGMRVRHVSPDAPSHSAGDAKLADWLGVKGDLTSDDPADTAGPSALATTLGVFRKPFLNGSYAESDEWPRVDETTRTVGALMGDPECGPVIIVSTTSAGGCASGGLTAGTEVFHLVVRGSCTIGGVDHVAGDMRVQRPGAHMGPIIAGPEGVDELIVLGDRRNAVPSLPETLRGWPTVIESLTFHLAETLSSRS